MVIDVAVMKEWKDRPYRAKSGVEVVPHVLTCMEVGDSPMLQLMDYVLGPDELALFGTLQGKRLKLRVNGVRNIFAGRARMDGSLVQEHNVKVNPK
jgi:hypothetical protein